MNIEARGDAGVDRDDLAQVAWAGVQRHSSGERDERTLNLREPCRTQDYENQRPAFPAHSSGPCANLGPATGAGFSTKIGRYRIGKYSGGVAIEPAHKAFGWLRGGDLNHR